MAISHKDYRSRATQLLSLQFQEATSRIIGFIEWIQDDDSGAKILQVLRDRDVNQLIEEASYHTPPKAKTPEDVAAIAMTIIDNCIKQKTDLFRVGMSIGVRGNGRNAQNITDDVLRRYIRPLLQHLEGELFANEPPILQAITEPKINNNKDVFIVHGRDDGAKQTVARLLQNLGLNPIILHEQSNRGRTIIDEVRRSRKRPICNSYPNPRRCRSPCD